MTGIAQPAVNAAPAPAAMATPAPAKRYTSVLEILLDQGKLSSVQADDLALEQVRSGKNPDDLIEEKHLVNEQDLAQAKSILFNIPYADLTQIGVSPEALAQFPDTVAKQYNALPFALDRSRSELSVVMANPLDLGAIEFLERKTGMRVKVSIAPPSDIQRAIAERYAQSLSSEVSQALRDTSINTRTKVLVAGEAEKSLDASEVIREAPIARIVETALTFALKARASDVHIEPMEERTRVRYRIDGILQEKLVLPRTVQDAVVSRIKILSDLKIDEKRIPQDGRFTFRMGDQEVDLRVSTLPTVHGEKVVMRLLQKSTKVPTVSELGMRGDALKHVEVAVKIPHGIVLVTGPTGSGKTTTLYSLLNQINSPAVNIVTLEDPVEYQMDGINQVQTNPQAGLTFASGLRSFLRQDPNIIMVGEIRDEETAELAVQASLTGHLVFSTVHTNSAAGALPRLLDMKAEPFLLASSMTLVMAQRVVRLLNQEVAEEFTPPEEVLKDIETALGKYFTEFLERKGITRDQVRLKRPKKDRPNGESEYHGRIGVFEVLPITPEISELILNRSSAADIQNLGVKQGMILMKQDGYLKVLEGLTTIEEVLRVAQT
jgi:type IV pilus assembly protein PilB